MSVAGKTGTAQHGEDENPHAWFVSFAPAEDPEIAVAVIVLDGVALARGDRRRPWRRRSPGRSWRPR